MRTKFSLGLFLGLVSSITSFSQSTVEYSLTANGNLYLPINSSYKSVYRFIGFGIGGSAFLPMNDKVGFKAQLNFSRLAYWDAFYDLRGDANQPLGTIWSHTFDYTAGLTLTAHYFLAEKFCIGTGLGTRALLTSITYFSYPEDETVGNHFYKPFMPIVPFELSYKASSFQINARYEQGIGNRLKGDLADHQTDQFGLIVLEVGVKLN